jgi:20S proteasome alpha/beta subunit
MMMMIIIITIIMMFRYDDNGGTVVAVAGDDYCIVAGSTRLSTGYSILTRQQSKILRLYVVIARVCFSFFYSHIDCHH